MGPMARYQETLRRLAMIDEGFVEDEAGLGPCPGQDIDPGNQNRGIASTRGNGGQQVIGGLP